MIITKPQTEPGPRWPWSELECQPPLGLMLSQRGLASGGYMQCPTFDYCSDLARQTEETRQWCKKNGVNEIRLWWLIADFLAEPSRPSEDFVAELKNLVPAYSGNEAAHEKTIKS